jgi:hypothetical protein
MNQGYISGSVNVVPVLGPFYSTGAAAIYSDYVYLKDYDKVTFIVEWFPVSTLRSTAMCCTGVLPLSIYTAYSATGGGASTMARHSTIGSTGADGSYLGGIYAFIYHLTSLSTHGNTLAINNITYTFSTVATVTTGTFTSNRYVQLENTPTATGVEDTYHHLAALINHADYGVPGVTAIYNETNITAQIQSSSSGFVYIRSDGEVLINVQATSSHVITPVKYVDVLDVDTREVAVMNTSHKYACVAFTPTSPGMIAIQAIRSNPRYIQSATGYRAHGLSTA